MADTAPAQWNFTIFCNAMKTFIHRLPDLHRVCTRSLFLILLFSIGFISESSARSPFYDGETISLR
jgi:hypothetical protein